MDNQQTQSEQPRSEEKAAGNAYTETDGSKPTINDLKVAILDVECERVGAQLSGFQTGFEHPNTQAAYNKMLEVAKLV